LQRTVIASLPIDGSGAYRELISKKTGTKV
jgi:hypothetical protein